MALNASEVRVAITGQLYRAPIGTTAPTSATEELDAAFKGLGYVSDDGVTESWDDSVEDIVAWQGATVVRSVVTQSKGTLSLTLIQTSAVVLEAFHRGSTMAGDAIDGFKLDVKPIAADPSAWVLDVIDGDKHMRIYVPNGEITERGEITYANGAPIGFPITISFYPDPDGNLLTKLSDDVAWTPTAA